MDWSILEGSIPLGASVGADAAPVGLRLDRANRHGVVAGATGTGKTVTLQIMAEGFSRAGVPVFAADVKGDLSGISQAGTPNEKMLARAQGMGLMLNPTATPTLFWDVFGQKGHPVRATVSEMGPLLLSRLMELNEVQEGVLNVAFRVADEQGLLLLDLKDLQAMLKHLADHAAEISAATAMSRPATVGTLQRKLLTLETRAPPTSSASPPCSWPT
jgi:DNA helicase HerA-like ATPase